MKNLLYIGNNLDNTTTNVSSIKRLGQLLQLEQYNLKYSSSYKNKIIRLLDMLFMCFHYRRWADILLIDSYSTQNFYYALIISQWSRWLKKPYICILHGGNLPKRLNSNPKLSQLIFSNAKINISPSLYLKNAFENKGYKNLIHIPNAIQIESYPHTDKKYTKIKLLWVRSFSKIYNPKMAIKVHKKLIDLGYASELCMIGPDSDGSLEDVKISAKELNVDVEFTGKLTKQDWVSKSKNYNIFINTTNFDNAPVSVIEAMALGFPIVSTNVGGMPFLIEHEKEGLLVNQDGVNAMVDAIVKIYKDGHLRNNLIENAQRKAETFDWEVVRNQWNDLLS